MFDSGRGILGTLVGPGSSAGVDATVTGVLIPPWPGAMGSAPFLYRPTTGSNKQVGEGITHLTTLAYTNGDTAHVLTLMRPKNYTWLTTALAANGTALVPAHDPGLYSTSYNYSSNLTTGTAQVANNAIAANDWIAIQLNDGTWHTTTITSGTFGGANLTLATAVPNVAGGGAAIGNIVYFFGVPTDKDPATGFADMNNSVAAVATSGVGFKVWDQVNTGFICALHQGDPLLFYDPGTTHLGTLNYVSGFYARY